VVRHNGARPSRPHGGPEVRAPLYQQAPEVPASALPPDSARFASRGTGILSWALVPTKGRHPRLRQGYVGQAHAGLTCHAIFFPPARACVMFAVAVWGTVPGAAVCAMGLTPSLVAGVDGHWWGPRRSNDMRLLRTCRLCWTLVHPPKYGDSPQLRGQSPL
jgi:hypothetical protein